MKIHYFQRYHSKENVDTANAMLLLSRLYSYSPDKFYSFLKNLLPENADVELSFNMQEKNKAGGIPDAIISQPSFKIVVETKLYGQFDLAQLKGHLGSFKNEEYKILLTLDPRPMSQEFQNSVQSMIDQSNTIVAHRHLTFEDLTNLFSDAIDDQDYEIQEVLDDYLEYCYESKLIPDDWKRMRMVLAGQTIDFNKENNIYYDSRGFSGHKYLGLYSQKAVRAVAKISSIITVDFIDESFVTIEKEPENTEVSEEMKQKIEASVQNGASHGWDLKTQRHHFFFVEEFIDTFFEKESKNAPMGPRFFNLVDVLGDDFDDKSKLPETAQIAELLKTKKWS